ncbi:putative regulator of G-protein signaling protein-like [Sesbania bispinosa]|nr:putative regulator of G-protein signaling protein-like [Sesbania bispinosa]
MKDLIKEKRGLYVNWGKWERRTQGKKREKGSHGLIRRKREAISNRKSMREEIGWGNAVGIRNEEMYSNGQSWREERGGEMKTNRGLIQ